MSDIHFIGDLIQTTDSELLSTSLFAKEEVEEIKNELASKGLSLNIKLENWPPKILENN